MRGPALQLALCRDGIAHVFRWADDGVSTTPYCGGDVEHDDDGDLTDDTDVCETCAAELQVWLDALHAGGVA